MAVDWTDPCARADALRDAYFNLLSGAKAQTVEYQDSGTQRSITYMSTKVDLAELRNELRAAEKECATGELSSTTNTNRFAIRGGALRR